MAVIHISEAEATRDLKSVMQQVGDGNDVRIAWNSKLYTVIPFAEPAVKGRKISEIIESMKNRPDADVLLDDKFGDDMEAIIKSHEHERLIDPWESF
jgi:hypothetical protein